MENELCRFGHHPNPAIDFCVEVEEIQSIHTNQRMGLGGPGFEGLGYEDDFATVDKRVERAMGFRVGGDVGAVSAKQVLRQIESERAVTALAAGSRRAKTAKPVECEASQSGPKGNAQTQSPNSSQHPSPIGKN